MSIGLVLKGLRLSKGLTQREVALDLNISQNTLSQYESEHRQPDMNTLRKLASYFEVSVDFFFNDNFAVVEPTVYNLDGNLNRFKNDLIELRILLDKIQNDKELNTSQLKDIEKLYNDIEFIYDVSISVEFEETMQEAKRLLNERED